MKNRAWVGLALAAASFGVGCDDDTDPFAAPVAGTAASCSSYGSAGAGTCAGWYCGTTAASIEAYTSGGSVCGGDPEWACSGAPARVAASCTRQLKSSNPLESTEQLRTRIQACVAAEAAPRGAPNCLHCYVERELCVQNACVLDCLVGDNPSCDSCRRSSGCEQRFYACSGLPSPF